jgi:hypothetical protein
MTPGALWLRVHQKLRHGLRVAWYRDVVRSRILKTPPVCGTNDRACEIHVLTSKDDLLNLLWALKSFYAVSSRRYAICVHEDGTFSEKEYSLLRTHFPDARIIWKRDADVEVSKVLAAYPRCQAFRLNNVLAPKIFDSFIFRESDRVVLFDTDLLFFKEPTAFSKRAEDPGYRLNVFNGDVGTAYTVDPEAVRECVGREVVSRVNTGFGLVHARSIQWEWIEEFLALPGILDGHFWRIEQTLFALCSSRYGAELLPVEYSVRLVGSVGERPMRHYVGAIRHLMYGEGMAALTASGFIEHLRADK